jgi:hypothetical protein
VNEGLGLCGMARKRRKRYLTASAMATG